MHKTVNSVVFGSKYCGTITYHIGRLLWFCDIVSL